jgi:hypothetical protein
MMMKRDNEARQELLAERHDHSTADFSAMRHITGQMISECLANVDWDRNLCDVLYTKFCPLTNSF